MERYRKKKNPNIKLRYNLLTAFIYVAGIILLVQLFSLQIINGATYRETSNTRLARESKLYATRGSILDRNGNTLATEEMTFSLEMYKTKIENSLLNETILKMINTLEQNGDSYTDTFPIKINPFEFKFANEEKKNEWLSKYELPSETSPEQALAYFKDKYSIENDNIEDIRKIVAVRYRISSEGYSATKSLTISTNISRKSALIFTEQNDVYPGLSVGQSSKRVYPNATLASHILGYINSISQSQYEANKEKGYTMNDIYGQTGIEYVFEPYLKGTNGIRQIDMSVDGSIIDEYIEEEAIAGSDVVLTIDANLQKVTEQALQNIINEVKNTTTYNANAGAVVVMDVHTGEILAMASYPNFEPTAFVGGINSETWKSYNSAENNNPLINRAISGTYAPGSTFKMVTATAALQTGNVTTTEKVNDTGIYPRGHNPQCWLYRQSKRGHGYLNITSAITKSCNYFFYEMGYRVGIDTLSKYAYDFGLGRKTGIELTNESAGIIATPEVAKSKGETWTVGYTIQAAIGQTYNSFTPLQMARYVSTLVNGGKQIDPTIVKTIINADKTEVSKEEIENSTNQRLNLNLEKVNDIEISDQNLDAILRGMKGVTSDGQGTAYSVFKNFGIKVRRKNRFCSKRRKCNKCLVCRICTL